MNWSNEDEHKVHSILILALALALFEKMRSLDLYIECSAAHQELPKQGCGVILNIFEFVCLQTNLQRHLFAQEKIAEKKNSKFEAGTN